MKLEQSFEVAAPIDRAWAALNDLARVAPCLPGAAITELWERLRRRFGSARGR